ncbi:hypothetical protein Tsubulata_000640 [Turnera subulata]|uniref:BHLH domain-containing protein n=1 Tax=Turnera subulata TaxID=218843 RepID=A0A9Q0JQB2_9ROSI|nr:hypothetical protein Tsubulata_000640 [Turnera subulata]
MAAFSYQHYPFLLDSMFLQPNNDTTPTPTTNKNMSGFWEEYGSTNPSCFPQFYPPQPLLNGTPLDMKDHEGSFVDHSSQVAALSDNGACVTRKQSTDSSTVVDNKLESGEQVTQKVTPASKKRRSKDGSSLNSAQSKDPRVVKNKKQKKSNMAEMEGGEKKSKAEKKVPEEPPKGYIHVRREKISERMKILQRLVPGCDKVTGKALMLDEIINYVQSLQNQVEFLSMKLASFNPLFYDFGMDMDAFQARPERLSNLSSSPLPSLQQCSPIQPTAFADANTTAATAATATSSAAAAAAFATANTYPPIDNSALLLLQGERLDGFTQDSGSLLWNVEEQRQKLRNPTGFSNNLCSFH